MDNKLTLIISAIAFLSFTPLSNAEVETDENKSVTIDCNYGEDYLKNLPTNLVELQQKAVKVGQKICLSSLMISPSESISVSAELIYLAKVARKEFDKLFPDAIFQDISKLSESWFHQITNKKNDYRNFALIEATKTKIEGMPPRAKEFEFELYSDTNSIKKYTLTEKRKDHCRMIIENASIPPLSGGQDCENAFGLWGKAVSPFQYLYTNRVLEENGKKITKLQGQWKTFIKDSRYQTPLDVWATTAWYSDQFKSHHLTGPPPTQLFLFHPVVVYEHLPDADKGSKEDVSIGIEWVGVNWWRSGFGLSVTSVYKDRKNQPSVGTGATFHIKNKYSIGYIYRDDGDNSIFFNIDLLEWFGDKDDKYNKYKVSIE